MTLKNIIFLLLITNIITGFLYGKYYYYAHRVVPIKANINYYHERNKLYDSIPIEHDKIIFLGDSQTQDFPLEDYFHNAVIINRGISGDVTIGVKNRLNEIIKRKPSKIFLEIGINDLGHNEKPDSVVYHITEIIHRLELTNAKIYIESIFPVANKSDTYPSYCNPIINKEIKEVNNSLNKFCAKNNLIFVNIYDKMVLNTSVDPSIVIGDGVHLTAKGYRLWAETVQPYL